MPHLARILVYPIKSLDPLSVKSSRVLPSGALEFDRQYAIVDASGKFMNAKRTALIHRIRAEFDKNFEKVKLRFEDREQSFHLADEREGAEAWLSQVFERPVRLVENLTGGFPDDTEAPGPTVVSTATLATVAAWFPSMTVDEARLRFRANLEIADVEAFWEDRLFGPAGSAVEFQIGSVMLAGTNPCQRCVVPTRHPLTGEIWPKFTPEFTTHREATLPSWAERSRFDHFYRLTTNTHLVSRSGNLRVGDSVSV